MIAEDAEVAVLVLNWNGMRHTEGCVESLRRQTLDCFNLHLVDNGSETDDRERFVAAYSDDPLITAVTNETNLGFAKGCNQAAARILRQNPRCRYLVFLNNDAQVHESWLESLVRCADETDCDTVGSKMLFMDEPEIIENIGHYMLNTGEILPLGNRQPASCYVERQSVFGVCAGAMLVRTSLIGEVGLFDEFFETGYEDAEFGARICLMGRSCIYEPSAIVYHVGSASVSKVRDAVYLTRLFVNIWYVYFKLMPLSVMLLNAPFILIKELTVFLGALLTGRSILLKAQVSAWYRCLFVYATQFRDARRGFLAQARPGFLQAIGSQTFFLKTYARYFLRYVVQRRRSIFDLPGR